MFMVVFPVNPAVVLSASPFPAPYIIFPEPIVGVPDMVTVVFPIIFELFGTVE